MTENEWLACTDLRSMISWMFHTRRRLTKRKWTLLQIACCRQIWHVMTDVRCRQAVEIAEQYVDGLASQEDLAAARIAIPTRRGRSWTIASLAQSVAGGNMAFSYEAALALGLRHTGIGRDDKAAEAVAKLHQVDALRDIVGDPFRPPPLLQSAWLDWNDGAIYKIALGIYNERRFVDSALLADALEDAGCTEAGILVHLHAAAEHVRGCWVLDLLLGKK